MRIWLSRAISRITRPALGWVVLAVGVVLVVLGWYGVAGQSNVAKQLPYLASGTIPGSALIIGGLILLGLPRQDPQSRQQLADLHAALLEPVPPPAPSGDRLVATEHGSTYHRAGCTLADSAQPVDSATIAARHLTPCPVCDPAGQG